MSVLIKGMEMPKSCFYCPFREKVNPDDYVCMALNKEFEETFSLIVGKRHKDCPLVPVQPHGDLTDQDAYRDEFMDGVYELCSDDPDNNRANAIIDLFDNAPTIIPASEEGE